MKSPAAAPLLFILVLLQLHCGGEASAPMPAQSSAFSLVGQRFAAAFPGSTLTEPDVRWWMNDCPGYDLTAVIMGGQCYAGLYYRSDGVDVAWRGSFGHSAYSHELMHFFLDQATGDSDPLHLRTAEWALVNQTDTQLQQEGR